MSRVFFTSDLHFGHKNLASSLRNMTPEESDALIIKNWNNTVSKRDVVYILGDITMEKHQPIESYIRQLQGELVIIGGNHDTKRCCKEYQRLGIPVMGVLEYKGFICTHIPVHPSQIDKARGNIHGHLHIVGPNSTGIDHIEGRYYNVNTEFHNYTPVPFTEIEQWFIDHPKPQH